MTLTKQERKNFYIVFHNSLDLSVNSFIAKTGKLPAETTLLEFMKWSYEQVKLQQRGK